MEAKNKIMHIPPSVYRSFVTDICDKLMDRVGDHKVSLIYSEGDCDFMLDATVCPHRDMAYYPEGDFEYIDDFDISLLGFTVTDSNGFVITDFKEGELKKYINHY